MDKKNNNLKIILLIVAFVIITILGIFIITNNSDDNGENADDNNSVNNSQQNLPAQVTENDVPEPETEDSTEKIETETNTDQNNQVNNLLSEAENIQTLHDEILVELDTQLEKSCEELQILGSTADNTELQAKIDDLSVRIEQWGSNTEALIKSGVQSDALIEKYDNNPVNFEALGPKLLTLLEKCIESEIPAS
ncbi:MAG: hypothetical protein OXF85_02445 [Candidatus Saccharibacteria bacterium]|nr:hypothetical protein [Candidatus Saccharibacteria bacterium]